MEGGNEARDVASPGHGLCGQVLPVTWVGAISTALREGGRSGRNQRTVGGEGLEINSVGSSVCPSGAVEDGRAAPSGQASGWDFTPSFTVPRQLSCQPPPVTVLED